MAPLLKPFGKASAPLMRWFVRWCHLDPDEPHLHLGPIGVAPQAQRQGVGTALMTAYAFLLEPLGFFLCTLLLVAFYLKVIAGRGWPVTLIFASAVALTSHIFFDVLLRAELPRGVLDWWM